MSDIQRSNSSQCKQALLLHPKDDVAVALCALKSGENVQITLDRNVVDVVTAQDDIDIYHKIAIHDVSQGADVHKYGEVIGVASQPIKRGQWVHIHNVESKVWTNANKSI
ncbi:UxaA family hydrolase [Coprothermobacter platensis]|uniref:UxaA family hydrolase n=1 Tax=Coprothermobacter platensis TaxID=108819 RepID=UPI000371222C|nr:UxaA family hydrolase [Coprothermobacter platensis]